MAQLKLGTTIAGNTAWHAGNDGTGSGLDADLIDGLDSLYLLDYTNLTNKPTLWPITGTDGQLVYVNEGNATSSSLVFYDDTNQRLGIGTDLPSAKLDVVGDIEVNSNVNLSSEAITLATITKTQIASFPVISFRSGKLIVQAYDAVTGEVQISELLVAHNGTTASATEYGVVFTGANSIVLYDVDINTGNVRLMATRTTANSTQYKISETLMIA